ncbi:MAG: hypothetical protein NWE89_16750 [Candidatus Bathyarchaeota archaeon]|nr:hypothetical protein [Candidatus Bathyarchaeota archaeon]
MIESYILILLAVVMAVGHFAIFRLVFDDDFDQRFTWYQGMVKNSMVNENTEFVNTMQDIIELDPTAVEMVEFGDKWRETLAAMEVMKRKRLSLEGKIHVVYYPLIASLLFSTAGLSLPQGLTLPFSVTFYPTSIGWWLLIIGLALNINFLVQYQIFERKLSKPPGPDINPLAQKIDSGASIFDKTIGRLLDLINKDD